MLDPRTLSRAPFQPFPKPESESFRVLEFRGERPTCVWHYHSEYQLSLIINGMGQRVIGDRIQAIAPGEVSLVGPNLPHVWQYDKEPPNEVHVIVVHFRSDFAGAEFLEKPEMNSIVQLFERSRRGLQLRGHDRDNVELTIRSLLKRKGLSRVIGLLEILDVFASSNQTETICSPSFCQPEDGPQLDRLKTVCSFVEAHLDQPINRDQAASVVHLTPNAFSRYFKQRSGITFQEFLNNRRIGHACRLLMDPNPTVTEISLRCGFQNITSFNRCFRRLKGTNPSDFRRKFTSIAATGRDGERLTS